VAPDTESFGRKRAFILLRYVFIIAAAYLILFEGHSIELDPVLPYLIAAALLSNVLLALLPETFLFGWAIQIPVLIADTLWIAYSLSVPGQVGQQFFLLYFFVLTLAAVGENLAIALVGSVMVGTVDCYLATQGGSFWTSPSLVRIPFFFTVALFYGHIGTRARAERDRVTRDREVSRQLERLVQIRTQEANARAEAMEALYKQAEESSRLKSEFVATMSHEFLSPLHVVLGYADLLMQGSWGQLDAAAQELVDRIRHNARRLLAMVTNVLDLAKVDAGVAPLFPATVDLAALAEDVTDPMTLPRPPFIEVRSVVPPNLPPLTTDGHKLRVVLSHLLSNAVKFTHSGGIVFTVDYDPAASRVTFTVSDTGIGIRPEDLSTIFQDFRQLDGSLQRRYEGAGLGLSLVRRYASLLGGTLDVSSTPGVGSTFVFSLPLAPPRAEEPPEEINVRQVA
jgi:signal transduction histidine kinase